MTPPEIELLLHRLLWPAWQVRWEAARRLAGLIEGGDDEAATGLVNWIGERRLESEAIIGLAVIDAFDLGSYFGGDTVSAAVKAPSHLSDALLRRTFGVESDGNYGYGSGSPGINEHVAAYFQRKMGQVIPLSCQSTFEFLQRKSGLPFLHRWEYEWQWLQGNLDVPLSSTPSWFTWEDHQGVGHFDLRQREVYLSAFLRTLAYAADAWGLDANSAEQFAMEVCMLDRGLARVEYRDRPTWTHGVANSDLSHEALAGLIWTSAQDELPRGRALLSTRAVDIGKREFREVEVDVVVSPGDWTLPEGREDLPPLERSWIRPQAPLAGLQGRLAPPSKSLRPPFPLTVVASPTHYARWHLDLFPEHLQVATPAMFHGEPLVESCPDGIGLSIAGQNVSTTRIWNTGWAPTKPEALQSRIGRTTDVELAPLELFLTQQGLRARRLAYIRLGRRKTDYAEFEVDRVVIWLDPEDGFRPT